MNKKEKEFTLFIPLLATSHLSIRRIVFVSGGTPRSQYLRLGYRGLMRRGAMEKDAVRTVD